MVMLSRLVGRPVRDRAGRGGKVADLAIDMSVGDYPPVTHVVVDCNRRHQLVPWSGVVRTDRQLQVDDLSAAICPTAEDPATIVLLDRDVMDALLLDLAAKRAVRANDVWLRDADEQLVVGGIDVSPWAIFRRLGRGWLGSGQETRLLDAKDVVYLRGDPRRAVTAHDHHPEITSLLPAQLADLAESLPYLHAAELLCLLPDDLAADVFEELTPELQLQVLGELGEETTLAIICKVSPDHAADVLGRLDLVDARKLLERLPNERATPIAELLQYPADTAGGIMTNEVVTVPRGLTIRETIDAIRPELVRPDLVYFVYVVADKTSCRLVGVLTLRDLLIAEPDALVDDAMNRRLIVAHPCEPAAAVAYRLADNHLNAIPVVDEDDRLLGVVTVDSALRQIASETVRQNLPKVFA